MAEARAHSTGRSRVSGVVLSLIFPGLGQLLRGRIFAGLLIFLTVVLYFVPLFMKQDIQYNIKPPSMLIAFGVWLFGAMDAFLYRSSFLMLALLVSLFCFGSGFLGAYVILPYLENF